jgi:hypothetical protein
MRTVEYRKEVASWRAVIYLGLTLAMPLIVQAGRLPIKTYTTADGLPRNLINRIVRDSRGFLWFCTGDGLSRFDGYTFKNYGTEHGLPHPFVNDFIETRNGTFWVATNGGGVARFNPTVRGPWSLVPGKNENQGPRTNLCSPFSRSETPRRRIASTCSMKIRPERFGPARMMICFTWTRHRAGLFAMITDHQEVSEYSTPWLKTVREISGSVPGPACGAEGQMAG